MTKQPIFTEQQLEIGLNYALFFLWCGESIYTALTRASYSVSDDENEQFHFCRWAEQNPRFIAAMNAV